MKEFWNNRYSEEEFAYGVDPNEFLASKLKELTPGRLLLLGEGEGRNAVFAAKLGWGVTAVDYSESAKIKAETLAEAEGVKINYLVEDLNDYIPPKNHFDAAAMIFLHLPESLRMTVHRKVVESIKPGGKILFEGFETDQIKRDSGGPKNPEMLYSLEDVITDFQDLDIDVFEKCVVELNEGKYHRGPADVIRFAGTKTE